MMGDKRKCYVTITVDKWTMYDPLMGLLIQIANQQAWDVLVTPEGWYLSLHNQPQVFIEIIDS